MRTGMKWAKWTYIRFGSAELELDDGDLGLFHASRTASRNNDILVENNTVYKFSVFDSAAYFLHNPDVTKVHTRRLRCNQTRHSSHCNGSKCRRVLRDNLKRASARHFHDGFKIIGTFEFKEVLAARSRLVLSLRSIGVDISVRYSTALTDAFKNDSAMMVGCIPF